MREFLNKPAGKLVGVVILVLGFGAVGYAIFSNLHDSVGSAAQGQIFIDSVTGKTFSHELVRGEVNPIVAPSGGKTGYPPELCYWTADGHPKSTPDYVLLNSEIGKPGPTFCPVCHRLVTEHNPPAAEGRPAPPTEEAYASLHHG